MPKGDVEVFHQDQVWRVQVEGEPEPVARHRTKEEAVAAGRDEANRRRVELIVRNQDGRIAERDTEGDDPPNIPG